MISSRAAAADQLLETLGAGEGPRETLRRGSWIEQTLPVHDRAGPEFARVLMSDRADQRAVAFWAHLVAVGAYCTNLGWSDPLAGQSASVMIQALGQRRLDWPEEEIELLWRSMALRVVERYQAPNVLRLLALPRAASRGGRAPVTEAIAAAAEVAYQELEVCLNGFWSRQERVRVLGDLAALMPVPPPGPLVPSDW